MAEPLRYRAFISYSHKDEAFVRWLHRRIETWTIPRDLVGRQTAHGEVPARLRPIFRDRDDFSGGSSLRDSTIAALENSDALIVVCSPNAAASIHVAEEIRQFRRLGRGHRIVPIVIAGEPGDPARECFPRQLLVDEEDLDSDGQPRRFEPIAADARDVGDGRHRAAAKTIAGILDLPFDEIIRRDEKSRRARIASLSGIGAGAFLFATALSSYALYSAYQVSLTVERGVYAIGGMIITTNTSNLDPAERDQTIGTQCDLMDNLAAGRLDLAGPEETAICFHRRMLALADTRPPEQTTTILCDWRDRLEKEMRAKSMMHATDVRALAFAIEKTAERIAALPDSAGKCMPKDSTDPGRHAQFALAKITELSNERPDVEVLRLIQEPMVWAAIEKHEAKQDWKDSRTLMEETAALRLKQSEGGVEEGYRANASMERAVYLRRLSWISAAHLSDSQRALDWAQQAVALWDSLVTANPTLKETWLNQIVVSRLVLCEALIMNKRDDDAEKACQAGKDMISKSSAGQSGRAEGISDELANLAREFDQRLWEIKRRPKAP